MKTLLISIGFAACLYSCSAPKTAVSDREKEAFAKTGDEKVTIKNDTLEYEITIIDPGFYFWLQSIARQRGYYSQSFLENRNRIYVINWNQRALQPTLYNADLYMLPIDYDPTINYGYEVNYQLYNYFIYFQRKYNQQLGPFVPRI